MITEELRAIVSAAGLTPAQGTIDQVLQALPGALASRPEMAKSLSANGYQKIPGGLIIQWGSVSVATGGVSVTFPIAFPTAVYAVTSCVTGSVSGGADAVECLSQTTSGFTAACASGSGSATYIAIGK